VWRHPGSGSALATAFATAFASFLSLSVPAEGLPGFAPGKGVDAAAASESPLGAQHLRGARDWRSALVQDGRLVMVEGFGFAISPPARPTAANTCSTGQQCPRPSPPPRWRLWWIASSGLGAGARVELYERRSRTPTPARELNGATC